MPAVRLIFATTSQPRVYKSVDTKMNRGATLKQYTSITQYRAKHEMHVINSAISVGGYTNY